MVKEDIIRGLEGAMSRGESLEKAMYSFYNAGYKKEDVEEAARTLSLHLSQQESLIPRSINFFSRAMPKASVVVHTVLVPLNVVLPCVAATVPVEY